MTFPLTGGLASVTVKMTLNAKNQVASGNTGDNPVLGDTVTETTYSDYKDLGEIPTDVLFPTHILQKQGGFPVLDLTVTKVDANNPYVVFPVPENGGAHPASNCAQKVETTKIADGVFYHDRRHASQRCGGAQDYVALIECPLSEERTLAVIAAVKSGSRTSRSAMPSTRTIISITPPGSRACAAEGATIVASGADKSVLRKVVGEPHTVHPDGS